MAETLNVDQRVKLMIGEMTVQNICMAKEIEDLRSQLAEKSAAQEKPAAPAKNES